MKVLHWARILGMPLQVPKNSLQLFVISVFFAFLSLWNLSFLWLLFSGFVFLCRSSCVNSSCERWKVWARSFQNHQRLWPWGGRGWGTNLVPHPHERHQLWGWQGEDHGRSDENLHQAAGEAERDFAEETAAPNGTVAVGGHFPLGRRELVWACCSTVSITDWLHPLETQIIFSSD